MSFDPFEPARILQSFTHALSGAASARTQDAFQDAKDRLTGERGDADLRRLDELRRLFVAACRKDDLVPFAVVVANYKAVTDAAHSIRTELFQKLLPVWPFHVKDADADEYVMKRRDHSLRIAKERLADRLLSKRDWYDTMHDHNFPIVQAATNLYLSAMNGIVELASLIGPPAAERNPSPPADEREAKGETPAVAKRKVPKAEAEVLVREWLKENAKDNPADITRDAVAVATGVSAGTVSSTAAWIAFRDERDAATKPQPREVPLNQRMQASIPDDCEKPDELAALIEEQESEKMDEERRHKRRHAPS